MFGLDPDPYQCSVWILIRNEFFRLLVPDPAGICGFLLLLMMDWVCVQVNLIFPIIYIIATVFITIVPMIASPVETGIPLSFTISTIKKNKMQL